MLAVVALALLAVSLVSCVAQEQLFDDFVCEVTDTVGYTTIVGNTLIGKQDRDLWIHADGSPLIANRSEKMVAFLMNYPEPAPDELTFVLKKLENGTEKKQVHQKRMSEYGPDWGGGFNFPEPGCWMITIEGMEDRGAVVLSIGE
jgi:hypothetical protein